MAPAPKNVVLITGAARRIGRAIALAMATEGWAVAVHYRQSQADAEALVSGIRAASGSAIAIKGDLANAADVLSLVPRCAELLAPPVCLINNASEFQPDTLLSTTLDTWTTHLDINLRAPVLLAQAMVKELPADARGNVINIIDQRVLKLTPEFFSYTISKSGLWTATKTLAQALAPRVRVNAIGPGPVLKSVHQSEAEFASECAETLLQRGPTPEEIAAAVLFILKAEAMTGQMIALDGGQHLG